MMRVSKYNLLVSISLFLLIGFFYFNTLLNEFFNGTQLLTMLFFSLFCVVLSLSFTKNSNKRARRKMYPWMVIGFLATVTNVELQNNIYSGYLSWAIYLMVAYFLVSTTGWQNKAITIIEIMGLIHVYSTIILYIFPSLYSFISNFYGFFPAGTRGGSMGYCAGLTNHYSLNGIYISIVFMVFALKYIFNKKKNICGLINLLCIFIALLLTNKRAMLIFSVLSLIISYIVFKREKIMNKYLYLSLIVFIFIFGYVFLEEINPELLYTFFGRFIDVNKDSFSSGRFDVLWPLAFTLFINNPIFGIGWMGYQYQYMIHIYDGVTMAKYLSPHNVYLQILCENGIVGFIILLWSIIKSYMYLLNYKKVCKTEVSYNVKLAFCILTFFILYGLTGCCLYDQTFFIFIIMYALGVST